MHHNTVRRRVENRSWMDGISTRGNHSRRTRHINVVSADAVSGTIVGEGRRGWGDRSRPPGRVDHTLRHLAVHIWLQAVHNRQRVVPVWPLAVPVWPLAVHDRHRVVSGPPPST